MGLAVLALFLACFSSWVFSTHSLENQAIERWEYSILSHQVEALIPFLIPYLNDERLSRTEGFIALEEFALPEAWDLEAFKANLSIYAVEGGFLLALPGFLPGWSQNCLRETSKRSSDASAPVLSYVLGKSVEGRFQRLFPSAEAVIQEGAIPLELPSELTAFSAYFLWIPNGRVAYQLDGGF